MIMYTADGMIARIMIVIVIQELLFFIWKVIQ